MKSRPHIITCVALLAVLFVHGASGEGLSAFVGKWALVPGKSTDIDLYGTLSIDIQHTGSTVTLVQQWGGGRSFKDTVSLKIGGAATTVPVKERVFPTNVFMGVSMVVGSNREIKANWEGGGTILRLDETFKIRTSQGESFVTSVHTYQVSPDGESLTYRVKRSTRTASPEMTYLLKKAGTREAYVVRMTDDWEISGKLPMQAFIISLQGLANTSGPKLYLVYPEKWDFLYTPLVFDYYKDKRFYTFHELQTAEAALKTFKNDAKGYVVWDKNVRTSLIIAFTVAGLEKAVVVSEEMIPMVEREGLKPVADFRGKFAGKKDIDIYTWAYNEYWDRCSKEYVVWMGGESGKIMKPGVADFGIYKQAFFSDLSCKVEDREEYALARKILGGLKPLSMIMGWHSYAKDKERDYVKLTSSFGHRVEGLHTLPNMSFSCQTPASPGFKFTNNHTIVPGKAYSPGKKVYIALNQTDGMGLGAWFKPGRGDIPCSWEVTLNWQWLAPSMLEFFHGMATPNDYFVGALSGPGYLYPKVVPRAVLPQIVARTRELMQELDLNVLEIMDYSEGATVEGNTDLTKDVVDAYCAGMPDALGFINGYAPSHTFGMREGKPLISFDYYLSETRPEADAAADLQELAAMNPERPYFLLIHIREYSDLKRTKNILDRLGPEFEVVPLDAFLKMSAMRPTFKERFREM